VWGSGSDVDLGQLQRLAHPVGHIAVRVLAAHEVLHERRELVRQNSPWVAALVRRERNSPRFGVWSLVFRV